MLKKKFIVFLLMGICLQTISQERTNLKALQAFAKESRIKEDADYALAVQVANQKGWPVSYVGKNGMVFSLQRIDFLGNPIYYSTFNNTIAAATTRANQLWPGGSSGLNLSGSSAAVSGKLGIWDGGLILKNHVEFATVGAGTRIYQKDSATAKHDDDEHATHTSGTLIASGVNPIAKGMAFGMKQLVAYDYYNEYSEMATEASNGLLVSNHSYGIPGGWAYTGTNWIWNGDTSISRNESYYFGYYSAEARGYDTIAYNAPNYLMVFAAGNSNGNNGGGKGPAVGGSYLYNNGTKVYRTSFIQNNPTYGSIAMGQTAKNTLIVGAVSGLPYGYNGPGDVQIASFSSWGPTDDGRIKPDIVADGVGVTSTSNSTTTSYSTHDGTSMASPNAAGSLMLLQEYYNQKHPGVFMRSATLKALAIQTADEAGTAPGPDYVYGYGLLNVLKAANVITSSFNQKTDTIIEKTLTSGTPYTISVVASGNGPLKATIVWTDPAATVITNTSTLLNNTTPRLINDLDLRISSSSNIYSPWILDPNNPTAAATKGDDKINNIEQVQIDSVVPGKTYTITVSNKGTITGTQAFSLIAGGIGGTAFCTSSSNSSSVGAAIDSVVFAGIANKNVSNAAYVDATNIIGSIEPAQTIPITLSLRTRDASSNPRVARVYVDYNGNGVFESTEQVAQTAIINSSTGKSNATVTTPLSLTIGNTLLMRVIVQETSNASDINPCGNYAVGETEDFRLKVIAPSHDIAVQQVVAPVNGSRFNGNQLLSVNVRNTGTTVMSNITFTATIKSGASVVANLTGSFPSTVAAGNSMIYTFQTAFTLLASTTYTITVVAKATGDQNAINDTLLQTITTAAKPVVAGVAEACSASSAFLKVTNPSTSNYYWYGAQPTAASVPIFIGTNGSTTTVPSNNTYYLASGARATVEPADKTVYGSGSYIAANTNYTYDSAAVPLIIETAKLYANASGQVKIIVNPAFKTAAGIQYYPSLGDSVTVDVYTDALGNDLGNDYYLNLHLDNSIASSYIISVYCSNGAAIFRNNAASVSYPVGSANLFQVVSNFASPASSFYYFLYNTKIVTMDSLSDATAVVATTAPTPVASAVGNVLTSSITTGTILWNLNGNPLAYGSPYTATQTGNYTVTVTDALGCSKTSNTVSVVVNAIQNVSDTEIGLDVSPNPNNGIFHVGFTIATKANVDVELISAAGQVCLSRTYPNFSGQFNQQFSTGNLSTGTYILKVQQNGKVYRKRVLIIK